MNSFLESEKQFVAYFYINGFDHVSFGFHFCWSCPNIEIHLPFGFFRIGWIEVFPRYEVKYRFKWLYRAFGLTERYNG